MFNPFIAYHSMVFEREPNSRISSALRECVDTGKSIEVYYLSKNAGRRNPRWRRISPHALCFDGFKLFVRAYCHEERTFKDFVLSRCLKTRIARGRDYVTSAADAPWVETVTLTIAANPLLERDQQRAVEYQHLEGRSRLQLRVRRALLPYLLRRLRFETLKSRSGHRLNAVILYIKRGSNHKTHVDRLARMHRGLVK